MKKVKVLVFILISNLIFSQVGINTTRPVVTLDVSQDSDPATIDGFVPPRISAVDLKLMDYTVNAPQTTGTMVYVTAPDPSPSGQTIKVLTEGYYFFDGAVWRQISAPIASTQQMILSAKVIGTQVVSNGSSQQLDFSIVNSDIEKAFDSKKNIYTVTKSGIFSSNVSIHTNSVKYSAGSWFHFLLQLQKSTDCGVSWQPLISDLSSGLAYSDVNMSGNCFWTGELNKGDQLRVVYETNHTGGMTVTLGNWMLTRIVN